MVRYNSNPPRMKLTQKLFYGVGHVLNDLSGSMWLTYMLVYLHYVLKISSTEAGLVLMIGQATDAICTASIGLVSDKWQSSCRCYHSGRRKIWHLMGTICVLCTFPFLFIRCWGCENVHSWALLMLLIPLVVIFQFGWAATQVSHLALIPELTSDKAEREELNIIRYTFSIMSDICVYSVTWAVLEIDSESSEYSNTLNEEDESKFKNIILIITAIGAFFSLLFHLGTKEPLNANNNEREIRTDLGIISFNATSHYMTWKDWFQEPQFFQMTFLYMGVRLFQHLFQIYIPLYLQESLKTPQTMIAVLPLITLISGFITSLLLKPINRLIGIKVSFLLFILLGLTGCVWIGWDQSPNFARHGVFCASVMIGSAGSAMLVNALSFIAELIGDNVESGAFVYGAVSFFDKLTSGIMILSIQALHDLVCDNCTWYYRIVMSLGVGLSGTICLIFLSLLFPQEIGRRHHQKLKVLDDSLSIIPGVEETETMPLLEHRLLQSSVF